MTRQHSTAVYAPASIGNFSVGFDVLGAAVRPADGTRLGDVVEARPATTFSLQVTGSHAHVVPEDPANNLVTAAYLRYVETLRKRRLPSRPLAVTLHKNLPVASGLGSSAASIVAALVAINQAHENTLENHDLLHLAAQLEGQVSGSSHFDNVAPALLGGLQLMTGQADNPAQSLPFPDHWRLVVSYPGTTMSTQQARSVLPVSVPMETAIDFGRRLASFVHYLHQEKPHQAAALIHDVLAEPYRRALLPGYAAFSTAAKKAGALAVGVSGSGPSVFCLCDNPQTASIVQQLAMETYCAHAEAGKTAFSHICHLDTQGAHEL